MAWGVGCYAGWSGDAEFLAGAGGGLVVDTARYWASRIERDEWLAIADSLVDGYDPASGLYEQFAGFDELEPLVIAELAPRRPIAADLLLGRARVESAQVIKQTDVLMLHHLVPDEVEPGSLGANLDFYEPRTAHASSLSPGIHAALLARAGRHEAACEALSLTARIDLDDISETTAGGLHLAFSDQLHHEAPAWVEEFLARFCSVPAHEVEVSVVPVLLIPLGSVGDS